MHLDETVLVVRRTEQDEQRVPGVVVGLRALAEVADVVAHEAVELEQVGELGEVALGRVPDVEPEASPVPSCSETSSSWTPDDECRRPLRVSTPRAHVRPQGRATLLRTTHGHAGKGIARR